MATKFLFCPSDKRKMLAQFVKKIDNILYDELPVIFNSCEFDACDLFFTKKLNIFLVFETGSQQSF